MNILRCLFLAALVVGCGAASTPPPSPTVAAVTAAPRATAAIDRDCATTVQPLYDALTEIEGRLDTGLTFDDYSKAVADANVAFERIDLNRLSAACRLNAGTPLAIARDAYLQGRETWKTCLDDPACDVEANTAVVEEQWEIAYNAVVSVRATLP